jgi:ribose transport system permease protein
MNIALHFRRYGTLTGFALMVIFFAVNLPETFLTPRNLLNVSQQISMLAVVAFTMTVVMSMGDFDLSVGTMASLAGVVAATLFVAGWPVPWAIAAALGGGMLGGLLNGFLVSILGILPFVATLGTMTVFGGLAFVVSDGRTIFGRDIPAVSRASRGRASSWAIGASRR